MNERSGDFAEQLAKFQDRTRDARLLVEKLTPRQRQVLTGLVAGESNKEIARELRISPRTVEIHRAQMMSRLRAQSAADAVRIGLYAEFAS